MNTLDTVQGSDIDSFLIRLNETIQWCSRPGRGNDPKTCLRTKDLEPDVWANGRKDLVEGVAYARENKVWKLEKTPARHLAGGRLLVYWPDSTDTNGETAFLTNGFFTESDVPPWDTWVAFFRETEKKFDGDYLICWIPADFIELASRGVEASATECIPWLDGTPSILVYHLLKERGLI